MALSQIQVGLRTLTLRSGSAEPLGSVIDLSCKMRFAVTARVFTKRA